MGDMLGYARVSTGDQDVAGQTLRLERAGAMRVFTDVRSGKSMDRPGLAELLAYARRGDTLAVVRLDRLGRSLAELVSSVNLLKERGIALVSLEERIDTRPAPGELVFHLLWGDRPFRAGADRRAHQGRDCSGARQGQAPGPAAGRPGQGRSCLETRPSRAVAHRSGASGWSRPRHRLP